MPHFEVWRAHRRMPLRLGIVPVTLVNRPETMARAAEGTAADASAAPVTLSPAP
ncbi:MAG: hypothetical protein PGN25_04940 [Methylorubrum populi]